VTDGIERTAQVLAHRIVALVLGRRNLPNTEYSPGNGIDGIHPVTGYALVRFENITAGRINDEGRHDFLAAILVEAANDNRIALLLTR
jgi:hypothetical protein